MDFFHADEFLVEVILVEGQDGIDDHYKSVLDCSIYLWSLYLLFVKNSEFLLINLLFIAVPARRLKVSIFFSSLPEASNISIEISLILLTAIVPARRRPLMIVCVLTPCSTESRTSLRISPAKTTTEVVPSPTSASCERAMSVRIRAAGWTMSSN